MTSSCSEVAAKEVETDSDQANGGPRPGLTAEIIAILSNVLSPAVGESVLRVLAMPGAMVSYRSASSTTVPVSKSLSKFAHSCKKSSSKSSSKSGSEDPSDSDTDSTCSRSNASVDADAPASSSLSRTGDQATSAAFEMLHAAFKDLARDELDPLALGVARALNRVLRIGLKEDRVYSTSNPSSNPSSTAADPASAAERDIPLKEVSELYVRFLNEAWIQATGSATGTAKKSAAAAGAAAEAVPMEVEAD